MKKINAIVIAIALVALVALTGIVATVRAASMGDIMPPSDFENRKNLFIAQAWDVLYEDEDVMNGIRDGKAVVEITYDDSEEAFRVYVWIYEDYDEIVEIEGVFPFNAENCRDFDDFEDLVDEDNARVFTETHIDLTK